MSGISPYLLWITCVKAVELTYPRQSTSWTIISSNSPLENSIKTANLLQCLTMCKYLPSCKSVTYDASHRACAFNSGENENRTSGHAVEKYQRLSQQVELSGPCENTPCQETAQCLPQGSGYICLDMLQCPVPVDPENGHVSYDGTNILSTRQFTCNDGYYMTGVEQSKCRVDGQWDNPDPVCLIVDCGIPTSIAGTSVQYTATTYRSIATYTCDGLKSFDGVKSQTVTCGVDSVWSELQGQCSNNDVVDMDGWILMFRATADINIRSYDIWNNSNVYHDHPVLRNDVMPGCRTLNGSLPCDLHFKSKLLNQWDTLSISQVRVVVLKKGHEMAEVVFDGQESDKESWFQKSKVTASTWTDLQATSTKIFSVKGWNTRRFYINHDLGPCGMDAGWLVVLDEERYCPSYTFPTGPKIMYAPPPTKGYIESEYLHADVMAVLVKLS